ncbi:MAG: hypothetical protein NTV34_02250, partial [Proteobacteria bacterium]|nr:hypothetical protein [Pseudomonadota bacterium]
SAWFCLMAVLTTIVLAALTNAVSSWSPLSGTPENAELVRRLRAESEPEMLMPAEWIRPAKGAIPLPPIPMKWSGDSGARAL